MIEMRYTSSEVNAVIMGTQPLSMMGQVIQNAIEWFMGEGVASISFERYRSPQGHCCLTIKALTEPKKFVFSNITTLAIMASDNYFPERLEKSWEAPRQAEGVKLMKVRQNYDGDTILRQVDMRRDLTIGQFAYGYGDQLCGFFVKGCTKAKIQASFAECQMWFNFGMDEEDLRVFMRDKMSYDPDQRVSELPVTFNPGL